MKQMAVGVGSVLLLLLGVLWFLRTGKPPSRQAEAGPTAPAVELLQPRQRTPPEPASAPVPELDLAQELAAEPLESKPRRIVRVHSADEERPVIPIVRRSVGILRVRVTQALRKCTQRLIGGDVRGKVYVTFRATSAGGRMSLDNVSVKQIDLADAELVSCIEAGVAAVTADAPEGQGDGSHNIQLGFVVP